jgi:phage terminase small subunit
MADGKLASGAKPGSPLGMQAGLNPQQERFVSEYLITSNGTRSAIAAGYSPKSAHSTSQDLLKHPAIKAAIAKGVEKIREKGIYGLEMAMKETEEGMEFARATKNATALASILQLRAKLNGLVIEKMDHRMSGSFQINIEGIGPARDVGPALNQGQVIEQIVGSVEKKDDASSLE